MHSVVRNSKELSKLFHSKGKYSVHLAPTSELFDCRSVAYTFNSVSGAFHGLAFHYQSAVVGNNVAQRFSLNFSLVTPRRIETQLIVLERRTPSCSKDVKINHLNFFSLSLAGKTHLEPPVFEGGLVVRPFAEYSEPNSTSICLKLRS